MEGYYYGYPRRSYAFSPYSNPNSNYYLNPFHNSNPKPNHYIDPYLNLNPQPNLYPNPYNNLNPNPHQNPNHTSKPRAVSIPIQFVNSDLIATPPTTHPPARVVLPRPSPEMAAVKLQKVIRGFLVRKNLRIVRKIEAEAKAIGEEIARDEKVLEKEAKARIRVGEMLMSLLFRLDSVRGVRDYRKKVIRKVISLQELVDSIGARGHKVESGTIQVERSDVAVDSVEYSEQNPNSLQIEENKVEETVDPMEENPTDEIDLADTNKCTEKDPSFAQNKGVEVVDSMEESPIEPIKSTETPIMKKLGEKSNFDEEFTEAQDLECDPTETLELEDTVERSNVVDEAPESYQVATSNKESNNVDMKGVRDVMERVVVESEKMKNLMEELCQSSAQQWRLMESLVDRVQRLEREVGKLERREKKKRKGNGKRGESCGKKCSQWNSS